MNIETIIEVKAEQALEDNFTLSDFEVRDDIETDIENIIDGRYSIEGEKSTWEDAQYVVETYYRDEPFFGYLMGILHGQEVTSIPSYQDRHEI